MVARPAEHRVPVRWHPATVPPERETREARTSEVPDCRPGFDELLVHGHTPLLALAGKVQSTNPWKDQTWHYKATIHNGTLNIDSGAPFKGGHLTAVEIPPDGDREQFRFFRVKRVDPDVKDPLWWKSMM